MTDPFGPIVNIEAVSSGAPASGVITSSTTLTVPGVFFVNVSAPGQVITFPDAHTAAPGSTG